LNLARTKEVGAVLQEIQQKREEEKAKVEEEAATKKSERRDSDKAISGNGKRSECRKQVWRDCTAFGGAKRIYLLRRRNHQNRMGCECERQFMLHVIA
jgi:hypothetical protein